MNEFDATFLDGLTTSGIPVRVQVDEDGVLHVEGLAEPRSYPLGEVGIADRLGNTVRSLSFPDGARCETRDNDAVDRLSRQVGRGRSGALLHAIESRFRVAVPAALLMLAILVAGFIWGIPLGAQAVASRVPDEAAYDLGRGTLATLDGTIFKPSRLDREHRARIVARFDAMAAAHPYLPLRLAFRDAAGPNAYALPDGTLILTDDLVLLAENDEQVASVLAHEIGHVHHRHGLRTALESSSFALLVGAYLGDITQLTMISAALPAVYADAHYSRAHETEADTFALTFMRENGIPPRRFAEILEAMESAHDQGGREAAGLRYLSSHPSTEDRLERFRE